MTIRTSRRTAKATTAWFLNDKVTINQNLTVSFGLRWDRYTSWLPEQGNSGVGPFATARIFPAQGPDQFPVYNLDRTARVVRL